ncbi:MAG: hypothetical protein KDK78_10830, partial [Chlamydiia bacterium]|nr:hypothetical protein [Chlamydiia bacterium]
QDEAKAESQLKENKARLEGAQERLADLASRHAQGKKWGDELQCQLGVKEKTLKEVSEQVDTKRALMEQLDGSLQTLNKELETKAAERELFSTELAEVKARQQALRKLKEEMEGLSSATKALIRESQDPASPVHGKLRLLHEELRPEQGYEAAVAAVIRPYLQTLLVDTEADLRCVLEVAAELELSDFSVLCLESLTAPLLNEMQAGNVTPLIEHVLEHSLASQFLGDAALTDSEDGVMSLAVTRVGGQIVSPKGVLRDLRGVLFFTAQGEHNAFLREAELRTLELRFEELTKGLEKLIEALGTLQRKKAEFDIQRTEIDQGIRRSEMKLVEANFGVQQCRQALAKHEQEFGAMDAERTRLQQVVNELEASIKDLTRQHENYSIRAQERASQLVKLERDLKKA